MIGKDYIPRADAEFNVWLRNFSQKLPDVELDFTCLALCDSEWNHPSYFL